MLSGIGEMTALGLASRTIKGSTSSTGDSIGVAGRGAARTEAAKEVVRKSLACILSVLIDVDETGVLVCEVEVFFMFDIL